MVNTNIQAAIPLSGKGLTYRPNKGYGSGEYKKLTDCELTEEGFIESRRKITPTDVIYSGTNPVLAPLEDQFGFIGNYYEGAVVVGKTNITVVNQYNAGFTRQNWWDPTLLPKNVGAGAFHYPVAFHRYNQSNHFITMKSS